MKIPSKTKLFVWYLRRVVILAKDNLVYIAIVRKVQSVYFVIILYQLCNKLIKKVHLFDADAGVCPLFEKRWLVIQIASLYLP
jgi:hypothetical protein